MFSENILFLWDHLVKLVATQHCFLELLDVFLRLQIEQKLGLQSGQKANAVLTCVFIAGLNTSLCFTCASFVWLRLTVSRPPSLLLHMHNYVQLQNKSGEKQPVWPCISSQRHWCKHAHANAFIDLWEHAETAQREAIACPLPFVNVCDGQSGECVTQLSSFESTAVWWIVWSHWA